MVFQAIEKMGRNVRLRDVAKGIDLSICEALHTVAGLKKKGKVISPRS